MLFVLPEVLTLVLGPFFDLPSLLATAILDSFSLFYLPNRKTLESPLDCKEIQPVPPKGNQSWVFIGRTDAEAETPVLWPPHVKNRLTGKDPDAGKD